MAENGEWYDVVVVGGGAAGLNAALVLGSARRSVAVIDSGTPRNASAGHMHGFLSRDGQTPAGVLDAGRAEVVGYGGRFVQGRAEEITADHIADEPLMLRFIVRLSDGRELTCRRVLIATGLRDELPALPGLADRWGAQVRHCPYCHGGDVADRRIGVLGTQPESPHQALMLRQWSEDVVYLPHTQPLDDDEREQLTARGIEIAEGPVRALADADADAEAGADDGTGVTLLLDDRRVGCAAVFIHPHPAPRDDLLKGLECALDDSGWVVADPWGRTSVAGVWAAGNVVDVTAQVITAAGAGSAAAITINADLLDEDVARAVQAYRRHSRGGPRNRH